MDHILSEAAEILRGRLADPADMLAELIEAARLARIPRERKNAVPMAFAPVVSHLRLIGFTPGQVIRLVALFGHVDDEVSTSWFYRRFTKVI